MVGLGCFYILILFVVFGNHLAGELFSVWGIHAARRGMVGDWKMFARAGLNLAYEAYIW